MPSSLAWSSGRIGGRNSSFKNTIVYTGNPINARLLLNFPIIKPLNENINQLLNEFATDINLQFRIFADNDDGNIDDNQLLNNLGDFFGSLPLIIRQEVFNIFINSNQIEDDTKTF